MVTAAQALVNGFRDQIVLSPQEVQDREKITKRLQMISIANKIFRIASVFVFALFPSFTTLFFAMGTVIYFFEAQQVLHNFSEILTYSDIEATARVSKENFMKQLTRYTFLVGPLSRVIDLPVRLDGIINVLNFW